MCPSRQEAHVTYQESTRRLAAVAYLAFAMSLLPRLALAQAGSASISGQVVDNTGGVLPGVTITVVNLATNQVRSIVTNERGFYLFSGLTPSDYSLRAELPGFAAITRPSIALNVGGSLDLDLTMQ